MRRFLDYYRQFQEMDPEEVSRGLRARRDAERARELAEVPPLDLSSPAWHEPPHAEIVNAATFQLRRALNAYPDPSAAAVRELLGEEAVLGHGAGELLRAACVTLLAGGGEVPIAWPGWGPLPRIVHEAGGEPVQVPLGADGAADVDALLAAVGPRTRAVALCSPNDPTGGVVAPENLRRLAEGLPDGALVLLDAALAEFDPNFDAPTDGVVMFRSFSKAHAMAGLRAGYAIGPPDLLARLAPVQGLSSPAQAGIAWAIENGERYLPRRRATAAREREHLAAALAGTSLAFPPGAGPLVWLSSADHDGPELAQHLASKRIFVTPGTQWGDDRHVRVTLRGAAATDRLVSALRDLTATDGNS
jgi:histidinol-phosphate/aromatic aminotransferase/cobyric acid decarboxylase-like protein